MEDRAAAAEVTLGKEIKLAESTLATFNGLEKHGGGFQSAERRDHRRCYIVVVSAGPIPSF
jgi:hypothetical protein